MSRGFESASEQTKADRSVTTDRDHILNELSEIFGPRKATGRPREEPNPGLLAKRSATESPESKEAKKTAADNETLAAQQKKITALVEKLGDDSYAERKAAESELRKHGMEALPVLLKGLKHDDLQIRRTADHLCDEILYGASKITIKPGALPVEKLVAKFEEQSGNVITIDDKVKARLNGKDISFDCKDQDFWKALDELCNKSQCHFEREGDGSLILMDGRSKAKAIYYSGNLRISLNDVSSSYAEDERNVQYDVTIMCEKSGRFSKSSEKILGNGKGVVVSDASGKDHEAVRETRLSCRLLPGERDLQFHGNCDFAVTLGQSFNALRIKAPLEYESSGQKYQTKRIDSVPFTVAIGD